MDAPGNDFNFCVVVAFKDVVPPQLVILAEATFANVFRSYQTKFLRALRSRQLPPVSNQMSANRADPVASDSFGSYVKGLRDDVREKLVKGGEHVVFGKRDHTIGVLS